MEKSYKFKAFLKLLINSSVVFRQFPQLLNGFYTQTIPKMGSSYTHTLYFICKVFEKSAKILSVERLFKVKILQMKFLIESFVSFEIRKHK